MDGAFTSHIETALSALKEERGRVAAERGAFARFRRHVAAMEPASDYVNGHELRVDGG